MYLVQSIDKYYNHKNNHLLFIDQTLLLKMVWVRKPRSGMSNPLKILYFIIL